MWLTMGPTSKCHFVKLGNPKIPEIKTPVILEAHNFLCKPLIEVKFKEKL